MALADSIPGISGGTIAYILDFYDLFIDSLSALFGRNAEKRKKAIPFLLQLGLGWVIGLSLCIFFLALMFERHIYPMSSALIGLTVFSIPTICINEHMMLIGKKKEGIKRVAMLLLGIAIVVLITAANPTSESRYALTKLTFPLACYLFLGGMGAISAMVLPGISGSSLIMIMGLYLPVITGIRSLMSGNIAFFLPLFCFGCGIIAGLLTTVKLVQYCIQNHRSSTISLILGMVIGAIYSIILGPMTLNPPQPALSFGTFSITAFLIGGAIILLINYFSSLHARKSVLKKE